jgi:hypothetical protein
MTNLRKIGAQIAIAGSLVLFAAVTPAVAAEAGGGVVEYRGPFASYDNCASDRVRSFGPHHPYYCYQTNIALQGYGWYYRVR